MSTTSAEPLADRAAPAPEPSADRSVWRYRLLVAVLSVATFGLTAFRALFRASEFVGPNLFGEWTRGTEFAYRGWWRPATPGYLWPFSAHTVNVFTGQSDPRVGALVASLVFYAVFGVALFEVFRRTPERPWLLPNGWAVVAALVLAGIESPAALAGWTGFMGSQIFLPMYLPFVPTTLGSLGLNVLLMYVVADLVSGRLPRARWWLVPTFVLLAGVGKPTLLPLLAAAALLVAIHRDLTGEQASADRLVPPVLKLVVIPAGVLLVLQTLTTIYKVQYPGIGYDDRGGWVFSPLTEVRELQADTLFFWTLVLFPVVALALLRGRLWADDAVKLGTIASGIGIVLGLTMARSGSVWRGDLLQLPESAIAMVVVFSVRRFIELWQSDPAARAAIVASSVALVPYLVAGAFSWSCHVGLGCPAIT